MKKLIGLLICCTLAYGSFAQDSASGKVQDTSVNAMQGTKKDCVVMKDGKIMMIKGGETTMLDKTVTLNNGSTVMTDGTVTMKDGSTRMLKEGQYVDIDGKMGMMKKKMKKENK